MMGAGDLISMMLNWMRRGGQMSEYTERYYIKRAAGISPTRRDGSECDPETDRQSGAAEQYAAELCGCAFNDTISVSGDGGFDFRLGDGREVDAVWMGFYAGTANPRRSGHLLINPDEPHRWAEVYVVIRGSIESGFEACGWTTHEELVAEPKQNKGYGHKYCMHIRKLKPLHLLLHPELALNQLELF